MLELIRRRAKGVFAWIIVIAITIPFALVGVQEYIGGGKTEPVAEVNGEPISDQELHFAYLQQRQRLQQLLGENFRPEMFSERSMKQRIIEDLVDRELLTQAARDEGMAVGDGLLGQTIRSIPAFQENGEFSREAYERTLRSQGMTPAMFESEFRRDLLLEQMRAGYAATDFVTESERQRYLALANQTRDLGWAIVPLDDYLKQATVNDQAVEQYYSENIERFMAPERVQLAYLELSVERLASSVEVSDEEVRQYYRDNEQQYRAAEERKVRHILFEVPPAATNEQVQEIEAEARQVLGRVKGGNDFAEAAREHSDDPGSAEEGGDLGFFGRGAMVPEFEEAAFSLNEGEISDLVRSQFGFHIIKVEEIRGGEAKPYEQVQATIREDLRQERASDRFYQLAERLANMTYEHPDSLEPAAEELGLQIQQSDWVTRRGGSGVLANPKVTEAAFSEEVVNERLNSPVVEISPSHLLVLRVREYQPSERRPLDEVREQIESVLKRQQAREAAQQAVERAMTAVGEGKPVAEAARGLGVEWNKKADVPRGDTEVDQSVVRHAFGMPHPDGEPTVSSLALPNGNQALVAVYEVTDGAAEVEADNGTETVRQAWAEAAYGALIERLRREGDVVVRSDRI